MTIAQSREFILNELAFREPVKFSYELVYLIVNGRIPGCIHRGGVISWAGRKFRETSHDPSTQVVYTKRIRDGKPWLVRHKPGSQVPFDVECASRVTLAAEERHLNRVCATSPAALLPPWQRWLEQAE